MMPVQQAGDWACLGCGRWQVAGRGARGVCLSPNYTQTWKLFWFEFAVFLGPATCSCHFYIWSSFCHFVWGEVAPTRTRHTLSSCLPEIWGHWWIVRADPCGHPSLLTYSDDWLLTEQWWLIVMTDYWYSNYWCNDYWCPLFAACCIMRDESFTIDTNRVRDPILQDGNALQDSNVLWESSAMTTATAAGSFKSKNVL